MSQHNSTNSASSSVSNASQKNFDAFLEKEQEEIRNVGQNILANIKLPLARIKKIIKRKEDITNMSTEALVVIEKAAEFLVNEMTLKAWTHTRNNKRSSLEKKDLKLVISENHHLNTLSHVIARTEPKRIEDNASLNVSSPEQAETIFEIDQQIQQEQPEKRARIIKDEADADSDLKFILENILDTEETKDKEISWTNQRNQIYDKHIPLFIQDVLPKPGEACYLHVIDLKKVESLSRTLNSEGKLIYYPKNTNKNLSILCTVKLPPVNPFPVFYISEKFLVTISASDDPIILTDQNIKDIEEFHHFIFTDALWLEAKKEFLPGAAPNSYYICPVIGGKIDWDIIFETKVHPYHRQKLKTKDTFERTPFDEKIFSDAVLMHSYKIDSWQLEQPIFHHVIRIREDLTPSSSFETDLKYKTYEKSLFEKYNVLIHNSKQPLVETIQMNYLHWWKLWYESPSDIFDEPFVLNKTKELHEIYKQYLVPELCTIHPFPSSFFFKVASLPIVLFRYNSLLLAEEIRQNVAREACVGTIKLSDNTIWHPFHFEMSKKTLAENLTGTRNEITSNDISKDSSTNEIINFQVKVDLQSHSPSPSLIVQALTAKSSKNEFNLERLKFIGSSFFKYSITIFTYIKYPKFAEGKLTIIRNRLIQNLTLYQKAKAKKLGEYMITTSFNVFKTWLPPCYVVEDHIDEKSLTMKLQEKKEVTAEESKDLYFTKQVISDKYIVDSVQALIGCYLLSSGQIGALKFMVWLGFSFFLDNKIDLENWPPPPPDPIICELDALVPKHIENLTDGFDRFENAIGYKFKNKAYLLQAFSHSSYSDNKITDSYQRLEFLGDSVLDYLISRQLYNDHMEHSPKQLTDLRKALVNNSFFASLAVSYKYHDFLKIGAPLFFNQITHFLEVVQDTEAFRFFDKHHFYLDDLDYFGVGEVAVPKVLGDIFESVAGAIYSDNGSSLDAVWKVIYPMIRPAMKKFFEQTPVSPVNELFDRVKSTKIYQDPVFRDNKIYIKVILPDGRQYEGVGPNKKVAKQTAAKKALLDLRSSVLDASQ